MTSETLAPPATLEELRSLGDRLARGEPAPAASERDHLTERVSAAVVEAHASGDAVAIGKLGSLVAIVVERAEERSDAEDLAMAGLLGSLRTLQVFVRQARTRVLMIRNAEARDKEVVGLRGRILHRLKRGPARTYELARDLKVDPTQVSRALRELLDAGEVELVANARTDDMRARCYGLGGLAKQRYESVRGALTIKRDRLRAVAVLTSDGSIDIVEGSGKPAPPKVRQAFMAAIEDRLI